MITSNLDKFKISTTKSLITSFAGLPLLLGMARKLGLEERLNALPVKERKRGYKPAESVMTLMGSIQSGGIALDDAGLLKNDEGMRELLGDMPASNTLGEFLRRFGQATVMELGKIVLATGVRVIHACGLKSLTLDIDAFFLESQKSDVEMNYKGEWGYNPVAVTCAELKMPLAGLFRKGAASPMANLAGLLKRVIQALPGLKLRARSDSAGYQARVVRVFHEHRVDFTITMRHDDAVMEAIHAIPGKCWQRFESAAWPNRETEIAETVHTFSEAKDLPAYRAIILRWLKAQPDLFDQEKYEYHAVMTSFNDWAPGLALQFHRSRQDGSENTNKEMSGGFGLEKLPCRELMANAAYFQIALLSHVVFTATKNLLLPNSWKHLTIKTVRHRMIRLAGVVMKRSRYLWLKISEAYPFREAFEEARWRLLGIEAVLSVV
jgi:hypothetical protein